MENENIYNAALIGVSDYYFKATIKDRRRYAPIWMDNKEKEAWKLGSSYAKQIAISQ